MCSAGGRTPPSSVFELVLADEFNPQLVVLDIGLPDLDGYEVARVIRAAEWGKSTVLVAATGWGEGTTNSGRSRLASTTI
jgi:DNA-binding response OmpR family regulator